MFHLRPALMLIAAALLLPAAGSRAATPTPDFADLPAYLSALNASTDPAAQAIHAEIADGPAALARERAACAKFGLPTTLAQLNQPLPPVAENAAPLYVQWDALRKDKPLQLPRIPGKITWPLNARYEYPPAYLDKVRAVLASRPDYTTLLDRATDRPRCVFAVDWTKYPQVSYLEPFAGLREAARTYSSESFLLAKEGRLADAVTTQAHGFAVARHAADAEPLLLAYLVSSAMDGITLHGMQTILQIAGPNAALDAQVSSVLAAHTDDFSLARSLRGESAVVDAFITIDRRATPADFSEMLSDKSPFRGRRRSKAKRFTPAQQKTIRALLDAAEARALAQTRGLVAAAALPRAARNAAFAGLFADAKDLQNDPVRLLSATVSPAATLSELSAGGLSEIADRSAARHAVAAAGAAVLAVRAQTGTFPDTLPAGLTDPYTDKPLGYRRESIDGFVVYSVGAAGGFTGGKPGDKLAASQVSFRYPAPPPVPLPTE